ncbi:prolyl oligopeptidase family serine peptidase [Mongoliibacter ruber]|uniref:prolyl oligopeptidase n=1 Tax=Mongoliibacter ruber TaxID=1750599 RepID=A0A2T0WTG2_9BACT|nr:prolyl oligopeptidase family serine peptidase [Mongoliibacter ruber]PRY89991.1 prolyl oligopeptidase [Mongoliibacter ruber]
MTPNKTLATVVSLFLLGACAQEQKFEKIEVTYPETRKSDHMDTYWGEQVADPYRWMEDDYAEETKAWVTAQNEVTFGYLEQIPFREAIRKRLEEVWNYEKVSAPRTQGDYQYYYRNDGLQNQAVMYRRPVAGGDEEVFLDPNKLSDDGTTSLAGAAFTEDGKLFAYAVSVAGSDWRDIYVMDTESKELLEDKILDAKFTGIAWKDKEGFFYSTYDKPDGSKLSALTNNHKLYYHKLGTSQSEDKLVFGDDANPRRYVGASVSEDGKILAITAANSTTGNELYIQELGKANAPIVKVVDNMESNNYLVDHEEGELLIFTNKNAPNNRLVKTLLEQPKPENWTDVIREEESVLSISTGGGKLFASYLKDAITEVRQLDYEGNVERVVDLPGVGTAGGFGAKRDESDLYYSFTSYITPGTIYKYDIESGESTLFNKPDIQFDPEKFESHQVFYKSKDGTEIPMIITHKKGLKKDGKNPTILYGYGGFSVSLTPSFSIANTVWLENGGVYAVPNLRGGGEYGENWHLAGTKEQKQNVFDDFIAAGEYLINEGYTTSDYLALRGGSNGGLLVGAVMTQRPDLAKVAFPAVGVLDMLRYHQFTAGAGWAYDYGTADDSEEMYRYLRGYSPLHSLKPASYPATLVTTADHDDRVVPAHSFKFAQTLQDMQEGDAPVLIRIETNAGHGAGKPTSMQIQEIADIYAFGLYNMGMTFPRK